MVVAVSKVDLLPPEEREERLGRLRRRIHKALATTRFAEAEIVCLSSLTDSVSSAEGGGLRQLVEAIRSRARPLPRDDGPFLFAIDHCFAVRGHGTVLTGTVLSGAVSVGDLVELPSLGLERRVKSMQMFRQPLKEAARGDRVGICLTGLDAQLVERGLACSPGAVPSATSVICLVRKVRFFRGACATRSKIHVSIGHATELSTCSFFGAKELGIIGAAAPTPEFSLDSDFEYQAELVDGDTPQWALIEFVKPVLCRLRGLVIGSKLDIDVKGTAADQCRIAFHGVASRILSPDDAAKVKIYTWRFKEGLVDQISSVQHGLCFELIASGLFSRGGVQAFLGLKIRTESGYVGTICSAYGNEGSFKVRFENGAKQVRSGSRLTLRYKRYSNDDRKTMHQGEELDEPKDLGIPDECMTDDAPKRTFSAPKRKSSKGGKRTEINSPSEVLTPSKPMASTDSTVPDKCTTRSGVIESLKEENDENAERLIIVIVNGLFRMDENIRTYIGRMVRSPANQLGEIRGPFGRMGKCKVAFPKDFSGSIGTQVEMDADV